MTMPSKAPIHLYQDDLPDDLDLGSCVAIDTETMGLNPTVTGSVLSRCLAAMVKRIS